MNEITTHFIRRLRDREPRAWFELWETFGPVLRAQLRRWGRGRIGPETVQDLSQETLTALAGAIDRHDPSRGARFSTWLLAIARYTLTDEIDRRTAAKRGGGTRPATLEGQAHPPDEAPSPPAAYEQAIFDAKVAAALRQVERDSDFMEFAVFRMRVLEGQDGRRTAGSLGISEPTVSRRLGAVRRRLRARLFEVFSRYSFTPEEMAELERNGIDLNPNKQEEAGLDAAIAEIYHRGCARRATEAAEGRA
ncbi:MAG: sigma-70 family RNA polymerase sigma factor [Planctomycetota bacterium]|nr:sigma-70 family RNA polymerase sigma factor [Planctomycetota bacterium]MDP6761602.1 sigma-70 family RNA polymerase sigma factor [Planctomycetota bacterium]MDP6989708.1 sigma-70 family RNA polymerase sigma factor [Planctomycetota bacterium]